MDSKEIKEAKSKKYYELQAKLDSIYWDMMELEPRKGNSTEFRMFKLALDAFRKKISADFRRYELVIDRKLNRCEVKKLQQSLNRERKLRQELETKIKEASESSGLFIRYVRNRLGI